MQTPTQKVHLIEACIRASESVLEQVSRKISWRQFSFQYRTFRIQYRIDKMKSTVNLNPNPGYHKPVRCASTPSYTLV
jgi:hypothetical protein